MNGIILKIIGQLGGRKWITTVLTSVLTPILAMYLPLAVVTPVVSSVTILAVSFIWTQGQVDKATVGSSSTSSMAIQNMNNVSKKGKSKTFKEMTKEYKNKKK